MEFFENLVNTFPLWISDTGNKFRFFIYFISFCGVLLGIYEKIKEAYLRKYFRKMDLIGTYSEYKERMEVLGPDDVMSQEEWESYWENGKWKPYWKDDVVYEELDPNPKSSLNKKVKKPLNQIQKICILIFVACFWLWIGFGDGFRPQYAVISSAIGITSIVAFFLFKDK